MLQNITYFDISGNEFDQLTLTRIFTEILPLCSHRLKVLNLSENYLTDSGLKKLSSILDQCGFRSLEIVGLKRCGLTCKCSQEPICPLSSFLSWLISS
jgi:hypothetical protein